ncbi:cation efflux family-domain-containing protein [Zychaea mexicana]|uniref:cation efflux family-domain-containing protein n=1 Tax=Zychaea mexicana TaxID=64656 RepID=UPI0022FF1B23|nr:cation efflux family-domain-containing protein [Zychaea mexicana]KAI9489396.1 cation efflux family-domain-containing protein [Zychaea mexicana]
MSMPISMSSPVSTTETVESSCRSFRSRRSLRSLASSAIPPPVHFSSLRIPDDHLQAIKNKRVRQFYQHQNDMIERFMEVDDVVEALKRGEQPNEYQQRQQEEAVEEEEEGQQQYDATPINNNKFNRKPSQNSLLEDEEAMITQPLIERTNSPGNYKSKKGSPSWLIHLAINLSFVANFVLFGSKVVLAIFTGSMAILASAFESFLDLLSNAIIFVTIRIMRKQDYYKYPVGKSRMEPLGIIVFAVVITTSFSQVLLTSVQRLTDPEKSAEPIDLSIIGIAVLVANIVIKGVLWLWCWSIKDSSSVQALAQDHENDVVFNIASTIFPVVAVWAKLPWLDPVGAILLSIYIIYEWMVLLLGNIQRLTGHAASTDDLKQLTYMAYRFSSKIVAVDTVRAYYVGDRLLVEVDIILPPDCPLREAHDVGEALQDALEMMSNVERAFVHLDYTAMHEIEHR